MSDESESAQVLVYSYQKEDGTIQDLYFEAGKAPDRIVLGGLEAVRLYSANVQIPKHMRATE